MKTSDFYYDLPKELIAQDPLEDRSSSRLLHLDRLTGKVSHDTFKNIISYLREGDVLVLNDTKVIPARLYGVRAKSGGKVEILLLKRLSDTEWECLVKPGKKCRTGERILFGAEAESYADGRESKGTGAKTISPVLEAEIVEVLTDGNRIIRFMFDGIFEEILDRLGEMPLPPYIHNQLEDRTRYNTVYAKYDGSAAAPTAGLHFTKQLLEEVRMKGVQIAPVTLHVGLGTFRPVKADTVEDHEMHSEYYSVSHETAMLINAAKEDGRRVICVGTTSCRTIESAADRTGHIKEGSGWTDIFIYPGYDFKLMDGLITNFHLPESTLVMLVSAFAGREHILAAYEEAVRERYRFFSFGDAMFIL